jgi:hypothetical protein
MSQKRALVKTAASLTATLVLGTAIIGVAHTPWGRPLLQLPLLSALGKHAGCPVGRIEPAAFEQVRREKLAHDVGLATAAAHPALAFTLGQTHRSDVERWTKTEHASCKAGFVATVLECDDVVGLGAPRIAHLRLQFDGQERLVAVDLFRADAEGAALVTRFQELGRELDARVGPATGAVGIPTLAFMKQSALQTVVRSYSYRDYVASLMLLNFGKRGLRLREQYQWLAPRDPA